MAGIASERQNSAKRTEIAYVIVETDGDDDLADRMWESNLRHGVQYTRDQRQTHGLKLHERELSAKEIADRVGVSACYRSGVGPKINVSETGKSVTRLSLRKLNRAKAQAEIAEETGVPQRTVSDILSENVQMRKIAKDLVDEEPAPQASESEPGHNSC